MKNDTKRQREFFERRRMQQRLKNLDIALPASTPSTTSGSMDLVTLFIVNQIAAKKEKKDPPKVAVLGSGKFGSKHKRNEPLVLPMSPCSPSKLDLVESHHQYSFQGKGKNVFPQGFKSRQLSPVFESAFSDNSASDYLPTKADSLSPFSSISSGIFPFHQRNQTHAQLPSTCSPPPWVTSELEHCKFQPFSQPRRMTDSIPQSDESNPLLYQLETPTASQVLFGSPDKEGHAAHEVVFSLNQSEDTEPMLDFTLNQSVTEQQFEDDVFRGFSSEDQEETAFAGTKSKIYLRAETPGRSSTPQTVPDSQYMEVESSSCPDMNCSCLQQNYGVCDNFPGYPCVKGFQISNSDTDETCCQLCMGQTGCEDGQRHSQQSLHTPSPQLKKIQEVTQSFTCSNNDKGSDSQQSGSTTVQFESPSVLAEAQGVQLCKCKRTSGETRDAETQTDDKPTAKTCDASTQSSFVVPSASKAAAFNILLPPFDVSVKHPATGGQTNSTLEPFTHPPSSGNMRNKEKQTPWNEIKSKAGSLSDVWVTNIPSSTNSDGNVILQRPVNRFAGALGSPDSTDLGEDSSKRGQTENGWLMTDPSHERREEVNSARRVNRLSEEAQTLQEIADILLLLKQRKEEGQ
ncbi:uncharacterized protein LOC117805365 isoform X1 [Xyrichtys novacula]|uniref:Uncharacterized protein LOC117805365 isoform X1 n=1 Tax=Xyrichtys novacula TaxID=13765 RepID=A0AAV1EZQ3_XYRNO|nr:uncharacterized protein LOC117805365 isoform X1 [Xyrichtys novacula]